MKLLLEQEKYHTAKRPCILELQQGCHCKDVHVFAEQTSNIPPLADSWEVHPCLAKMNVHVVTCTPPYCMDHIAILQIIARVVVKTAGEPEYVPKIKHQQSQTKQP